MSERWVINQLFRAQATSINWSAEKERLDYEGPELQVPQDAAPLQFRWLLHPSLGLPRQPFFLWHLSGQQPAGRTTQELANLPDWELIEIIGLPVDDSWTDTGYDLSKQGLVDAPLPPVDAALQRLQRGAPRIGWTREVLSDSALPDWQPSDLEAYLKDTLGSTLLQGIQHMLLNQPNPTNHASYTETDTDNTGRLRPHLLLNNAVALNGQDTTARSEWPPLGLLLLGAGSDPLVSLTLGFGTAVHTEPDDLYMVSVRHQLSIGSQVIKCEIADVITPNTRLRAPDPPANLSASIIGHNRPQMLDGPALETVGVTWERALNPSFNLQAGDLSVPVSYVVGRSGPETWRREILLTRRPDSVEGWFPFVASKPSADEVRSVCFADHIVRSTTIGSQVVADPLERDCTYAVASQDIFGRWSTWNTVAFQGKNEAPQLPSIVSVQADVSGAVTVDFSWDWSDRSPEFIELIGAYEDAPSTHLFTAHMQFGGGAQPTLAGGQVTPLDAQRAPITTWGSAQDVNPTEPEVRFYRLSTTSTDAPIHFAGHPSRTLQVQGRGQCHVHNIFIPGWNVSPFGLPFSTQIYDPTPPSPPTVPEAPQWASLRDVAGVSRAVLQWQGDAGVAGYVVYEATETTLLAALGCLGPDTSQPFTNRLAVLRAANLPALRSNFRRLQKELVTFGTPTTSFEVALPRGSSVMHFYAVTAISHNQVESSWPTSSKGFIAVAVPRLVVPAVPTLEANIDVAQTGVNLRVGLGGGPAVSQVELYRVANEALAASVDTMGPPISMQPAAGSEVTFTDSTLTQSWRRVWYRAVAWSTRDDLQGLVEARSLASPAVQVLMPPQIAPDVSGLTVIDSGSSDGKVMISWTSKAPIAVTPLGSHHVVLVAQGPTDDSPIRLESLLDAIPTYISFEILLILLPSDSKGMARVRTQGNYSLYAWLPRPATAQSLSVTVKMIDPLGRIGSTTIEVPAQ